MVNVTTPEGGKFLLIWEHRSKAGLTKCIIVKDEQKGRDNKVVSEGTAECSEKDQYCKETGRKFSLTRALKAFTKEARTQIWDDYKNRPRPKTEQKQPIAVEETNTVEATV